MHETYTTLIKQLLPEQRIVKSRMEIPPKLQENKDFLFKGPPQNPDANMLDGVPSWTAVSRDQFITQFQGKAKKVLFQKPCPDTGLVGGWTRHSAA